MKKDMKDKVVSAAYKVVDQTKSKARHIGRKAKAKVDEALEKAEAPLEEVVEETEIDVVDIPKESKVRNSFHKVSKKLGIDARDILIDVTANSAKGFAVVSDFVGDAFSKLSDKVSELELTKKIRSVDIKKVTDNITSYSSHFTESGFADKLKKVCLKIGDVVVYNLLLLYEVMKSDTVSFKDKAVIAGCLGYFILPIDLIPDFLPAIGYADDITVVTYALGKVKNSLSPEILQKARSLTDRLMRKASKRAEEAVETAEDIEIAPA